MTKSSLEELELGSWSLKGLKLPIILQEKLGQVWERAFEVMQRLKSEAYSLRDTSRKSLPRPWNVDNLDIYYI